MTRLLLLRHAESEWNAQGRWQGLADPPLSARGEQQAAQAGRLLRPMGLSALVSSDLQRARSTAERIATELPLVSPPGVDAGLREYDVGAWSGLTRIEIEAEWPGAIDDWRHGRLVATPGGERHDSFVARISVAVARVAATQATQTIGVITHGGVIRALCQSLGSPSRRFPHLAGVWIDAGPDGLHAGTFVSLLPQQQAVPSERGEVDARAGLDLTGSGVLDAGAR